MQTTIRKRNNNELFMVSPDQIKFNQNSLLHKFEDEERAIANSKRHTLARSDL